MLYHGDRHKPNQKLIAKETSTIPLEIFEANVRKNKKNRRSIYVEIKSDAENQIKIVEQPKNF